MATSPVYISTFSVDTDNVATANTAIDGTGTIRTLSTGTTAGRRILEVTVQSAATSATALVNLFVSKDTGTTWRLFDQITITAATSSTTVKANRNTVGYDNLVLTGTTQLLGWTTTIAQSTNVVALGGDLT
jgi:hypothetical protein